MNVNEIETVPKPRGYFKIETLDLDGNVKETFEQHNLVVNNARQVLAKHMAKRSVIPINKLVLGTKGHIDGNYTSPKTQTEGFNGTRTQLFAQESGEFCYNINFNPPAANGDAAVTEDDAGAGTKVVVNYSNNTITYEITIPALAGNGSGTVGYTEAAMFAGDDMFCMRTFGVRSKDISSVLKITWVLIF